MAYKINVDGIDISADTATEMVQLVRAVKANAFSMPEAQSHGRPATPAPNNPQGFDIGIATRDFLLALRTGDIHGKHGLLQLMKLLHAQHAKGTGARLASINAYLKRLGLDAANVYSSVRAPTGRRWSAGPMLPIALDRVIEDVGVRGVAQ